MMRMDQYLVFIIIFGVRIQLDSQVIQTNKKFYLIAPTILIPDTIIYNNSAPINWYFSQGNTVKQKSKSKLTREKIYEHFVAHKSRSGVVALWISIKDNGKCEYNYMDEVSLFNFFENRVTIKQGMLQGFVDPKGDHNFTIRCIWGPKLCFFEKNTNIYRIDDTSVDMYQRILTYEVDKPLILKESLIGRMLPNKLEHQTFNLVDHIQTLTHDRYKITRMVLNYRLDENDQVWLVNCSALRVIDKASFKSVQIKGTVYDSTSVITIPEHIDQNRLAVNKNNDCWKDKYCDRCDIMLNGNDLYPVQFKDIIESWNFDHLGQAKNLIHVTNKQKKTRSDANSPSNKLQFIQLSPRRINQKNIEAETVQLKKINKNYRIPDLIRKLLPRLKEKIYLDLTQNPCFLERNILVCQRCYVKINKGVHVNQDVSKLARQELLMGQIFYGVGELKPQIINKRFELTRNQILTRENVQTNTSQTIKQALQINHSSSVSNRSSQPQYEKITSHKFHKLPPNFNIPVLQLQPTKTVPLTLESIEPNSRELLKLKIDMNRKSNFVSTSRCEDSYQIYKKS